MKKLNLLITGIFVILFIGFYACGSGGNDAENSGDTSISQMEKKMDTLESSDSSKAGELGIEYTAKYVCPMHCKGSGSDKPGKCKVCEMDMIENPNAKK